MAGDLGITGFEAPEEIGRGAFGVVYRARQPELDRAVAIKVLTGTLGATALRNVANAPDAGAAPPVAPPVAAPPSTPVPPPPVESAARLEPAPRKRRRSGAPLAIVIALGLIAGAVAVVAVTAKDDKARQVEVPNVVGSAFDDARSKLEDLGFKVSRVEAVSDAPIGEVTKQVPSAGTLLDKKRTVVLTVSAAEVLIPNLEGKTFEQAQRKLTRLGLVPVRKDVLDESHDPGTVVSTFPIAGACAPSAVVTFQSPPGGSLAAPGSDVTITC